MFEKNDQPAGISAVLIIFNEEKIIERCLKSLAGVVDEIIVIHDGECTDSSLEICRKYTDKISIEPHMGEAEFHNIKALEKVSYSWVLRIDADEFLSEELRQELRAFTKDDRCDMYSFIWPIWDGKSYITKGVPYKDVLFRMERICAVKFPHKTYSSNGTRKKVPLILEHQPKYNNYSFKIFKGKWIKWMKVQTVWTYHHKNINFYNYTAEQKEAFHKNKERQIQYSHPLFAPAWFLLSFLKFVYRLQTWNYVKTIKVAFFQGLYAMGLCYFLWLEKKKLGKQ